MWKKIKKVNEQEDEKRIAEKRLYDIFLPYWEFLITKCNYDPFEGVVQMLLKDPEKEIYHELCFKNVSLYLFLNNLDNTFEDSSFREMSIISFRHDNINKENIKQDWLYSYKLDFNIAIEIVCSTLVIKAETVIFDGIEYKLHD